MLTEEKVLDVTLVTVSLEQWICFSWFPQMERRGLAFLFVCVKEFLDAHREESEQRSG